MAKTFEEALLKGLVAAGYKMKKEGGVLITVRDARQAGDHARWRTGSSALGFTIYATAGTAKTLNSNMIAANAVRKLRGAVAEHSRPVRGEQDRLPDLHQCHRTQAG